MKQWIALGLMLLIVLSGCMGGGKRASPEARSLGAEPAPGSEPDPQDLWGNQTRIVVAKDSRTVPPTPVAGCGTPQIILTREPGAGVWPGTDTIEFTLAMDSTLGGLEVGHSQDGRQWSWTKRLTSGGTWSFATGEVYDEPGAERWSFGVRFDHGAAGVNCMAGVSFGKLEIRFDAIRGEAG